ncbi:uncharacterized protein LOC131231032 [Magnolia sinica]|uniref:uncharacterized protein LOC131231032 n=1 Tax=Magnolia sinica TaxID=86752 RepID=UPI002657EA23|nr:uncharacterized protein LOC131231032 [Magnolia sinica]
MFRATKWRSKKNMIKAIFKLQFWATQVPQLGWDSLMVSLVPVEVGKPTAKSEKAAIHEGNCQWENPIYETVRFTKESKYGKINKKIYRFLILTGSLKAGLLGEVTIDFADYAEAIKPSSVSLPLKASNSGGVLHVRIQRIRTTADAREMEENGDVTVRPHGRTLKSELSNCDTDGSCNTCSDISNCNCTEDSSSVTGIMQSSLSHDKATSQCAESDGILRASSCSDSTSASNCSSGKETPQELGFKNSNIHRDVSCLPLSVSNNALPLKRTADAVHSVTDFRQHRRLNTEWSVSSAPDGSLDDSTNSFEGTHLKERPQASDVSVENLKNEMIVLARQADVSELELQTLRKQIAKERRTVQDLSWEVRSLKEERDGLNRECEKLKVSQQNSESGKVSAGLKFEREDLRNLLVEIEQELDYAKVLNINLQLQLQKTQESNSELIRTVQDLEERLEKKNKGIQEAESGNGDPLSLPSEMNREDHNVPISNIEYSLQWKIVQLCNEIEVYRKDREELETQMEQLALDYEILKLENHSMTLKLEQTQLQEQLTMPSECSAYLAVMDDLEVQVESLEKELEKRVEVFEADLATIGRAKVEQEQRAIRAEEALRKMRWNNASTAERLQEEFNNLAMQMSLALDASERRAMQAVTEAKELRLQKVHQENLLVKANEELGLARVRFEVKLKELSDKMNLEAKQMDKLRQELEEKSNELENLKKPKEAGERAFLEEIGMLRMEIERLEREKNNLSERGREEALKEADDVMCMKDGNEKMVGILRSEVASLQNEYNQLKQSLLKDGLEKENLRKQVEINVNEAALKNTTHPFLTMEKDLCKRIEELEKVTQELNENNPSCKDKFDKMSDVKDVEDGTGNPDNCKYGRNKAGNLLEPEMGATACIPDRNAIDVARMTSTDGSDAEKGPEISAGCAGDHSDNDGLLREMALLKERNKSMECELKEMQGRYSEMSLNFAEVEGERQQLLITIRCLKNANMN